MARLFGSISLGFRNKFSANPLVFRISVQGSGVLHANHYFLPQRRKRFYIIGVNIKRAETELKSTAQETADRAWDVYVPLMQLESAAPETNLS